MSELRDRIEDILDKAADWEWAVANEVCAGDGLNRDEATDAIMSLIESERAEKKALAQKCDDWKYEAYQNGSALWRVMPNMHTIHVPGINEPGDPFEGPGETYEAAYARVMVEKEALREAVVAARNRYMMATQDFDEQMKAHDRFLDALATLDALGIK